MNRQDDAKFGMMKASHSFLAANTATITAAGSPILNTYTGDLETLLDAIGNTSEQTAVTTKSITATKAAARKDTTDFAVQIASAVFSYAQDIYKETGDDKWSQLANEMEVVTPGFFAAKKDEEVTGAFYNIWTIANDLESASPQPSITLTLSDYGIKPDVTTPAPISGTLTLFDASITNYTELSTSPRVAISTRKTFNQKLSRLYDDGDAILEKMDKIVLGLQRDYPDFYNGWQNARMIVVMSLRAQIVGQVNKVTDLELRTTAPVEGAKLKMTAASYITTKNKQKINVQPKLVLLETDEEGKYSIPTPDHKTKYTVKCMLPGYEDEIKTDLTVKRGKKTQVDFLLLPVQAAS